MGGLWELVYRLSPLLTGGCHPVHLHDSVRAEDWDVRYYEMYTRFGLSSEILVAQPRPRAHPNPAPASASASAPGKPPSPKTAADAEAKPVQQQQP